ncbi:MAG: FAD-linked oxidoreductase [Microbacteriaceae bacterium]|nr:FAD-linked oxidoreductase [Microbacteriaceae bacterium]
MPAGLTAGTPWRNWGRSERITPVYAAAPRNVGEVQQIVRFAVENGLSVKAIGAGHSFTGIAVAPGIQLDLTHLHGIVSHDAATGRVTLGAGTNLHQLPALLRPLGLALTNMGDIDRQTIAGATSTGTHGTGAAFGGLATQVTAVTLVTAAGDILRVSETENAELLPAARLGLGALGVLVDLTIQCVPTFLLSAVEDSEPFDQVLEMFDERVGAADHFEFYWFPHTDVVATKTNTRLPADADPHPLHPVGGWFENIVIANVVLSAICGLGRMMPAVTPPINRLASSVYGKRRFTDDSHDVFVSPRFVRFREMEYNIPREAIPAALREVRALIDAKGWRISFPVEVRVSAPDDNWLSTAQGRESGYIAVHRHYRDDPTEYFQAVEQIMRGYLGRPHWGKMHYQDAESLALVYPHHADFVAVRNRLDPGRVFTNPYLERVLGQ